MKRLSALAVLFMTITATAQSNVEVVLETELGAIEIELFTKQAPASTGSFLKFVDEGRYEARVLLKFCHS